MASDDKCPECGAPMHYTCLQHGLVDEVMEADHVVNGEECRRIVALEDENRVVKRALRIACRTYCRERAGSYPTDAATVRGWMQNFQKQARAEIDEEDKDGKQ